MPVVVLSGMRQTGKSTLLHYLPPFSLRTYVSFDDYNTLDAAQRNPEGLIVKGQLLTIDEAQKFPDILTVIKQAVDKNRRPGMFILSGSANFLLLKNISESLAGRAVYFTLYPFTYREIHNQTQRLPALIHFMEKNIFPEYTIPPLTPQNILAGGMPQICLGEVKKPDIWFRGYEQTYLERDIRALSQVGDLMAFRHLLQLIAMRNACILNQSELARDAKLNVMTTSRYISLLESSCVIFRLYPYLANKASRLIKSPKVYLSDTGLAAYLSGIKERDMHGPLSGALLENYVAQNLLGILSSHEPDAQLTYWNIQGRFEVDFIIEYGHETIAIEVKNSTRWKERDLVGIKAFMETSKNCRAGILAYTGSQILQLEKNLWAVPLTLLIS